MARHTIVRNEKRENAKRRLGAYRKLVRLNKQNLQLIEEAESRLFGVTAQVGEVRGSGAAKDAIADNLAAEEEHARDLRRDSDMYGEKMDDIKRLVERVFDVSQLAGDVLAMRYLVAGKPPEFSEIADELHYTEGAVKNAHLVGLDLVAEFIDDATTCDVL